MQFKRLTGVSLVMRAQDRGGYFSDLYAPAIDQTSRARGHDDVTLPADAASSFST